MKYIILPLFICVMLQSHAQINEVEEYRKTFLSSDMKEQQQTFLMKYIFAYYALHEIQDTASKGTRTLQVMKTEIKDTLKPFFNTIAVNAQTLAKPISDLKNKSRVGLLFNSALFSEGKNLQAFEGSVELDVTSLPYRTYMQIYSNITSVNDPAGNNILVNGKDTILDTWIGYQSGNQFYNTIKFTYNNTNHPDKLTVNGTVTIKVPTKFLIVSFTPAEIGTSKAFQQYTFTLKECAAGKVIISSNSYTSKSGIEIVSVGPSNIRYKKDQGRFMGGTIFTDDFIYDLAKNNNKLISNDTLIARYFDQYVNYIKTRPVKVLTVYSSLYRGNIQKVYVLKPIEYYTITETFSFTSK